MTESWTQWEGQVINGEFHLQKYLGSSDHSVVFLTDYRERGPQQAVIKLIPADAAKAELLFSHWSLAEGLFHPSLLQVSHKGRCRLGTAETAFVVVEYAEENLAQIVPVRPLTPAEVQEMLEPVLDVLLFLHQQGLVHGGLKPANIMAANDKLKLSCDSLCRTGERAADHEKRSAYDPPEKGNGGAFPAGDVWSLGITLVEVLTQHLPSSLEPKQADLRLPKDLPDGLADIVRGCLHPDPAQRWTIAGIKERLHPQVPPALLVPQEPPKPREQMPVGTAQAKAKRRFPVTWAVVAVVVIAVLIGVPLWHHQASHSQSFSTPEQKPKSEEPGLPMPTTADKPSPASPQAKAPVRVNRGSGDEVLYPVLPKVPEAAQQGIQGTVRVNVKVQVDPSGSVVGSEFDSAGPSPYFARLAMDAAPKWRFMQSGQDEKREFVLHFEFRNNGVKAFVKSASR